MTKFTEDQVSNIVDSLLNGDEYEILLYDEDSNLALFKNLREILDFKKVDDRVILYYEENGNVKELEVHRDIGEKFMLIPIMGELNGEKVFTGQKVIYKGVTLAITYQDGQYVYLLDGEENDLFGISIEKFNENWQNENLDLYHEFVQPQSLLDREKEKAKTRLVEALKGITGATQVSEEAVEYTQEQQEDVEEEVGHNFVKEGVTLALVDGKPMYVCYNSTTNNFDLIDVAFVGNTITGLEYSRKTVENVEELHQMINQGRLKILTAREFFEEVERVVKEN